MFHEKLILRRPCFLLLLGFFFFAAARSTFADAPAAPADVPAEAPVPAAPAAPAGRPPPSENVTINLINLLVERRLITREDADKLIRQAEDEAAEARAQAAATQLVLAHSAQVEAAVKQAARQQAAAPAAPASVSDNTIHVTYVPEMVKAQLRDEIKQEVMTEARQENWASPRALPPWVSRFNPFGDIRIRYDGNYYPSGNLKGFDNNYWNYNAINTSSTPFDYTAAFAPFPNVDQTRNRVRLRARLGVAVDLSEGFTSGLRLATGENNSPVTENQSLGAANSGQGGDFSKYALWLDRAFLKYEVGGLPDEDLSVTVGRFDNPFFATSVIWADDLGFDGAVMQGKYPLDEDFMPFFAAGAFPVFNTDFNFSTNQPAKFKSEDRWLYGGQLGFVWEINEDFSFKTGTAYYYFQDIQGKVSEPFTPIRSQDAGNTDDTRPAFAQRGNTYVALRNIVPNSLNNFGTIDQFQYFGLATPFHELALTAELDYNHFEPFQVSLSGEYVKNLAFDRRAIERNGPPQLVGPVNNFAPNNGGFDGGGSGWIAVLKIGKAALQKRWDWNVSLSYRRVDSDAVVDGFTDSDFGGGGTNLKGYTFNASLALSPRVWLGLHWMSADALAGPPFKDDTLQFDINGKL